MKIKLYVNNIDWPSLPERLEKIKEEVDRRFGLIYSEPTTIDVEHVSYSNLPIIGGELDSYFFISNFHGEEYDCYALLIDRDDWKGKSSLLGEYVRNIPKLNFYIITHEFQKVRRKYGNPYVLEDTFMHELGHCTYQDMRAPFKSEMLDRVYIKGFDNTHYFCYQKGDLDAMYQDILELWKSRESGFLNIISLTNKLIMNIIPSNRQRFYKTALSCLGKDVTPKDFVPDEVACAETVNEIYRLTFGETIGGGSSTYLLFHALVEHPDFEMVKEPKPGDIIISPSGYGNKRFVHNGHVGIMDESGVVMSNTSKTGLFEPNFTLSSWDKYFVQKGKYPVFFFRRK